MSSQVLAYSDRMEVVNILENEVKEITGFKAVVKESFEDFCLLLDILVRVDLIIIDAPEDDIKKNKIIEYLIDRKDYIRNIIFLSDNQFDCNLGQVFTYEKFEIMIESLKGSLAKFKEEVHEYVSVPIDSLFHFKVLSFDLFLKISKDKYIKRIPACEEVDRATINSLKSRGGYELYFDKKYNKDFSQMLLNNMMNSMERDYHCYKEESVIKDEIFLTTKEIVQSLGLPPRIISLCDSVMGGIIQDISRGKNQLSSYIHQLKESNLSFHFRHIELTSYIASQIVDDFQSFASSDFTKRVIFSAFFCDVTLRRPELIHIRTQEQLMGLNGQTIKEINMHALKASELVLNYQNAPIGAHRIIRQHHGALNGIGFSDKHYDKLCPLTKCLISSQELAYSILNNPEEDARVTLARVAKKYASTPLQDMFDRFEEKCRPYYEKAKIA